MPPVKKYPLFAEPLVMGIADRISLSTLYDFMFVIISRIERQPVPFSGESLFFDILLILT